MEILEYFSSENKTHWLSEIGRSDWGAGKFLYRLLSEEKLGETVGESTKVLLLTDGEKLVSFCTFAEKDDIQPTELTPWIGWVYTFPEYRGNRFAGKLLEHAEKLAEDDGVENIYISTNHIGLYEKYGYEFYEIMKAVDGEDSRVYIKRL
ncbi:MAG: GNAT family N-acetyltransferase [Oscillospiraceae bacterium]|nr:GNAT family N-acetyltransferase [Oscillospiraceae bacterium]